MSLSTRKGAKVLIFEPGAVGNPRTDAHMVKCSACQGTHFLPVPMLLTEFVRRLKLLDQEHRECKP